MKDFPVFTTEHGVGSLIFKEIPYQGAAFVKIHDVSDLNLFIRECVEFSRMAGADCVYATGSDRLESYPFHTSIYRMRISRDNLADTDACLMPVNEAHLEEFRHIYNVRMKNVHNHSYMTQRDAHELLQKKEGYFVHRGGELIGIGIASGETIRTVIACQPGKGADVLLALNHALTGETAELEVASENTRALRLYERLGFVKVHEISKWYKIF